MEHFQRAAWLLARLFAAPRARMAQALLIAAVLAGALPAHAQRFDRGLLWRIEGGGAPASHVFGTIHLSDPRVTKLPPDVARALGAARSLSVEVGLDPSQLMALAARMVYTDGRELPGTAGPELFQRAAAITGPLGLPEQALRLFRPWAVALLLSLPPQKTEEVLDVMLMKTATEQGKPVHELETLDEQIAVFEGLTEAEQVTLLRSAVENYPEMPRMIERMVQAWLARDLAAMERISDEVSKASGEARRFNRVLMQRILNDRNARMAERMQARLTEGGAFVAIGALHLYGGTGVLADLERRGWRVTRVY